MVVEDQSSGRFVDVDGARLYLESWGDANAPVLLCLHGLGGGTHFFSALGVALADRSRPDRYRPDRYRTVAIDLPGSGLSPSLDVAGVPPFSFDTVADLVVSLARSEHLRGARLCLLGHSMGTILALEVIRRAPDLAAALIVVGGLPEPLPGARARITARVEAIRQRGGLAGMGTEVVAANFAQRTQIDRPELTALFAKLFDRQDPAAYAATATALTTWTARELPALDRASAPVSCLAITGEEDRYAPPDAFQAFARTLPPATRVEIMRDCGHLPFLEQPAAFAAIVSSFLRGIATPDGSF